MTFIDYFVNSFVSLFALIDPIGMAPLFAIATASAGAKQHRWIAFYIAVFTLVFLAFFFLTGLSILKFFGISMPAFRIAGGILLLLMSLDMTRGDFIGKFDSPAAAPTDAPALDVTPRAMAQKRFQTMIVPFAIPLLIGPGAISTVIIQAGEAQKFETPGLGLGAGLAAIVLVGLAVWICMAASRLLTRALGKVGLSIVVKLLGLILCAMAIQFIISGFADATRGLIKIDVAKPYASAPKKS